MRYTIKDHYEDDDNNRRHVKEFIIEKGDPPEDFPKFIGIGVIEVSLGTQSIPRQFSANLNAETIDEAFGNFDKIMNEASEVAARQFQEEMMNQMAERRREEASRIVVPGQ